jgi:hypothetical protein
MSKVKEGWLARIRTHERLNEMIEMIRRAAHCTGQTYMAVQKTLDGLQNMFHAWNMKEYILWIIRPLDMMDMMWCSH